MNYSYFPGCTLKTKGAQLDRAGRLAAEKLGFSLCEIPEWQCCGAVYPQSNDEIATRLSSVRALMAARDAGQPLVSLCSACHHVLKRVNGDMQHSEDIRTKVNNYLKPETPYAGETRVLHYLEVLRDEIGWDKVKEAVVKPLTGRKIGAYYGCMLLRPSDIMAFDDPENPKILGKLKIPGFSEYLLYVVCHRLYLVAVASAGDHEIICQSRNMGNVQNADIHCFFIFQCFQCKFCSLFCFAHLCFLLCRPFPVQCFIELICLLRHRIHRLRVFRQIRHTVF